MADIRRPFRLSDHYWVVAESTDTVWSSKAKGYVPTTDEAYQAWLTLGLTPTPIDSEEELWTYLKATPKPDLAPPDTEPPGSVSRRQFMMQLRLAGLRSQVLSWVNQQDGLVQDAFYNSGSFVKSSPMMQQGFASMGFTQEQIDAFFQAASVL